MKTVEKTDKRRTAGLNISLRLDALLAEQEYPVIALDDVSAALRVAASMQS